MKKVKINSSLMHIIKARLRQKIGASDSSLTSIEQGTEDDLSYVKMNNDMIFFHQFKKNPVNEVFSRYQYSHYEIDKKPHPIYGIHRNHTDNLLSLKVDSQIKKKILEKFPIHKDDVVLELGAFYGFGSMKLSKLVGNNGKVISVEADKNNFKILKQNLSKNNITNVTPINKGIWNKSGHLKFFKEHNQRNSLVEDLLDDVQISDSIEVDTVDNILSLLGIEHVDLISMEINAAEINGLKGMDKILSKNNIRLMAAGWYDFNGKPAWIKMKEILENYGFEVFIGVQNRVFAFKE